MCFPDLNAPTVVIMMTSEWYGRRRGGTMVTFPVETAVNGATHVRRVRSIFHQMAFPLCVGGI